MYCCNEVHQKISSNTAGHKAGQRLKRVLTLINGLHLQRFTPINSNGMESALQQSVVIGQLLRRQPCITFKIETKNLQGNHFWSHLGFSTDLTDLGRKSKCIDAYSSHMKKYQYQRSCTSILRISTHSYNYHGIVFYIRIVK